MSRIAEWFRQRLLGPRAPWQFIEDLVALGNEGVDVFGAFGAFGAAVGQPDGRAAR
jgi:hypothetical protein